MANDYAGAPHLGGNLMSARVSTLLMQELKSGVYQKSERLPSEVELAAQLNVSRTVIRDALSDLEREGFIDRVRGIGTVVNREIVALTNRLDLKLEYNELISSCGYRPSTDSVRLHTEKADEEMAERLGLDLGEPMVVCEKRMLAEKIPVIYSIDWLPCSLFGTVNYSELDWSAPIFDLLERCCGLTVVTEIARVSAVMGPAVIRDKLGVAEDGALLMLDEISCCKLNRPVMRSFEYYSDFFEFTMLRKKF